MSSQPKLIQLLESMNATIRELVAPIEEIQLQTGAAESDSVPNGLELIARELTMVVLVFTNVDLDITNDEIDALKDLRRAVCGDEAFDVTPGPYLDMCRNFLRTHPNGRLSIDHQPDTIRFLQIYDRQHGTQYSEKAKAIFFQLASSIVQADGLEKPQELMTLGNFKDILDACDTEDGDLLVEEHVEGEQTNTQP